MRRARERRSMGDSAGVSSMKILESASMVMALVTRLQSSSSSWPVLRCCWSTRPSEEIRRKASWLADISIEKTATALLVLSEAYSAMLSASEVLPIAGRAARMMRSDGCSPAVMSSRSMKPVGRPVIAPLFSWRLSRRVKASCTAPRMGMRPVRPRAPASAMRNTSCSAFSSTARLSRPPGWKASLTMFVPTSIRRRRIAFSRTMSA